MKIRLAKKIMACDINKKTKEERRIIIATRNWYWVYRFSKYYTIHKLKDPARILVCDHRITKAISLTRK